MGLGWWYGLPSCTGRSLGRASHAVGPSSGQDPQLGGRTLGGPCAGRYFLYLVVKVHTSKASGRACNWPAAADGFCSLFVGHTSTPISTSDTVGLASLAEQVVSSSKRSSSLHRHWHVGVMAAG